MTPPGDGSCAPAAGPADANLPAVAVAPRLAAAWSALVGATALAGWASGHLALARIRTDWPAVRPTAAVCLLLMGASLGLLADAGAGRRRRRLGRTLAAVVAAYGLAVLLQYLTGRWGGLDTILFGRQVAAAGDPFPGRPPPHAAVAFALTGLTLLLLDSDRRHGYRPAVALAPLSGAVAVVALVGYAYGAAKLYGLTAPAGMPMPTVVTLMVVTIGVLLARPDRPPVRAFTSRGPGGVLARRLLPALVALPVLFAALDSVGARRHWYEPALGRAVATVATMTVLLTLVALTVRSLERADADRRRLAGSLAEAEALFRSAFDNAPMGMALMTPDGRWLRVNQALCDILGYPEQTLLAMALTEITHPDDRDSDTAAGRGAPPGPPGTRQTERRYLHADGHVVWGRLFVSPVPDPDGGVRNLILQLEDVTAERTAVVELSRVRDALVTANAELTRANADLEQYAFVAAHDLKAPLQVVAGYAELLTTSGVGAGLNDKGIRALDLISQGTSRMQELVDDLLRYARIGQDGIHFTDVDLPGLVDDVLQALAEQVRASDATVVADVVPTVVADPVLLRHLLANLVSNAIKYRRPELPPRVDLAATAEPQGWRFVVADNGIGVDPAHRDQIFQMFRRLHPRGSYEGTGIGLAICSRIVEYHRGRIWVDPDPGGGSRFCFTLRPPPIEGPEP